MRMIKTFLMGMFFLLLLAGNTYAHKVNIYAYAENGKVFTKSYFNDGKPAINSTIEVYDRNKKLLLTGRTDQNGEFSFDIPQAIELYIVLNASMGHRNEYILSEDEVRSAVSGLKAQAPGVSEQRKRKKEELPGVKSQIDSSELEAVLSDVLERKIAPIMERLIKIERDIQKPSISEVLGGIGYILGLMGIGIYFKYRQKR